MRDPAAGAADDTRRHLLRQGLVGALTPLLGTTALAPASASATGAVGPAAGSTPMFLDDASRMNRTAVDRHLVLRGAAGDEAFLDALRRELATAARTGRAVVVGAARHSMGGQALPADGVAITFDQDLLRADAAQRTYRVHAGARWHQVIRQLDPLGFSPAVMQSNADFGIAGTLGVNAHGWPAPFGPFGETVRSFRLMKADGEVVRCARDENAELFGLVIGGYGLFGIVLEVELEMVDNTLLDARPELIAPDRFGERMAQQLDGDPQVRMAYGRMSVARDRFFDEALLVTWRPVAPADGRVPPATAGGGLGGAVSRELFRAQIGSDAMKKARWVLERRHVPGRATRNTLMNEPVANLAGRDRSRTDILHEYFVPPERFGEFVVACRELIPGSGQDLLNVTLRWLAADTTSVLAYAPQRRIAAVMLFSQPIDAAADRSMQRLTERMIERVLALGGNFYLPYRLHARRDQVERAYPRLAHFIERKLHHDPKGVFRHAMWQRYFS